MAEVTYGELVLETNSVDLHRFLSLLQVINNICSWQNIPS